MQIRRTRTREDKDDKNKTTIKNCGGCSNNSSTTTTAATRKATHDGMTAKTNKQQTVNK